MPGRDRLKEHLASRNRQETMWEEPATVFNACHLAITLDAQQRQSTVVMMDTPRWSLFQVFHRGIGRARGEHPVIPRTERAISGSHVEGDADAMLQDDGGAGKNHAWLSRLVEVDEDIPVDIEHLPMLVPATHAGMLGRVRLPTGIGGEDALGQRLFENERARRLIDRLDLAHFPW